MKKFFILSLLALTVAIGCSKSNEDNSEGGITTSEGSYTVKAVLEGTGQLFGARIYLDTELGNEAKELSAITDAHIRSMVGKKEWEGNYPVKKSIQCTVNARFTDDNSVLTVYLW